MRLVSHDLTARAAFRSIMVPPVGMRSSTGRSSFMVAWMPARCI